jgi:N-acetylneuraminic acid mutarotase
MNLATHGGKIYRVGGMQPRNKPGDKADNHSTADAARFDPATKTWEALPPLPAPRSSHDVAVVGDTLVVVGGWNMTGKGGNDWLGNMLTMDLSAAKLEWTTRKQPFERRALIAAVSDGKVYVIGGFDEDSNVIRKVDIYDPKAGTWGAGPDLPGKERNGFSPAACSLDGRLYISVADGTLYRLDGAAKAWTKVAATTPRIVHRMAAHGSDLLVIGGAAKGENLSLIENVTIAPATPAR